MQRRRILWLSALFLLLAIGSVAGGMLFRAVAAARAAAARMQCSGLLCQINCALHAYHEEFRCFPPAYIAGPGGKPMHSWRILVMKYLDPDVFHAYDLQEPWNGPNNSRLAKGAGARLFQCPAGSQIGSIYTNYVVIVGQQTVFPGSQCVSLEQIPDSREPGVRDTILVVEIATSDIPWMEPCDLQFDQMSFRINGNSPPSISSYHPGGANLTTRGSSSGKWFPETTDTESLKNLIILDGK